MFPFDPPSLPTRLLSLALFALSLLFFIAGLGVYRNSSLHTGSPNDDMGGDADWAELMMLAFLFMSLFTTLLFVVKRTLHLGWYIGIDLFVCMTLLAIAFTSIVFSRFAIQGGSSGHCSNEFRCEPKWKTVSGLFVTGYAFAIALGLHHGVLFSVAARKLDVLKKAEKRERLGEAKDVDVNGEGVGLGDMPERKV